MYMCVYTYISIYLMYNYIYIYTCIYCFIVMCAIGINSWASDCKHNCELRRERQLFEHITSLGEATIPADANTGQAPHCAHKETCFPFILFWRRSCTPQGGMLLVTSLGEATIPADANTGQACRRVIAVGSSPAYHRLSHANT